MRLVEELTDYKSKENTVLTIGKFDGFHRGHQLLINKINECSSPEVKRVVLAFDIGGNYLLSKEEQRDLLREKVDVLISSPLEDKIRKMPPQKFVEEILVERLKVKTLVVGVDFRFGHEKKGNLSLLNKLSKTYGFQINVVPQVEYDGEVISSTIIKKKIEEGQVSLANQLLGYEYPISGIVATGKQFGRTLGFPTLNTYPDANKVLPKFGVYRCKIELMKEQSRYPDEYDGLCNIGIKPTVTDEEKIILEAHAFDFDEEAYGRMMRIKFLDFIRAECKFNSISELKKQIKKDIIEARKIEIVKSSK